MGDSMSYSGRLQKMLKTSKVKEGSKIRVTTLKGEFEGTVMPHHEFSDPDVVVLKLKSGYNIGITVDDRSKISLISEPPVHERKEVKIQEKKGLPNIVLIGTGGTIASYVDYRTGAVHPAMSAADMVNAVPEIREIANISANVLFSIFSENMDVGHWQELAKAVEKALNDDADAVIIPHGTDTMGYTAAALSFMLTNLTKPVVLVGAQRSSDRPSSDAYSNLLAAARFCASGTPGVFVVMHNDLNDNSFAVHVGSRARKMHTSRRDAFRSINVQPFAVIDEAGTIAFSELRKGSKDKVKAMTKMEPKVVLLQYYPGMDVNVFRDIFMNSKGIVISGSGLGHVNSSMIPLVKEAVDNGAVIVMASQCLNGSTNMNVYNTGRDLMTAGVISVNDMLPETAYVKLMWALANTKNADAARDMMKRPVAGEMGERRCIDE